MKSIIATETAPVDDQTLVKRVSETFKSKYPDFFCNDYYTFVNNAVSLPSNLRKHLIELGLQDLLGLPREQQRGIVIDPIITEDTIFTTLFYIQKTMPHASTQTKPQLYNVDSEAYEHPLIVFDPQAYEKPVCIRRKYSTKNNPKIDIYNAKPVETAKTSEYTPYLQIQDGENTLSNTQNTPQTRIRPDKIISTSKRKKYVPATEQSHYHPGSNTPILTTPQPKFTNYQTEEFYLAKEEIHNMMLSSTQERYCMSACMTAIRESKGTRESLLVNPLRDQLNSLIDYIKQNTHKRNPTEGYDFSK